MCPAACFVVFRGKVIQSSIRLRNALWLPNLVRRTGVNKGNAGVIRGQAEDILLRIILWLPNLIRRTPDQSVVHCWGLRSCMGHRGLTKGQIAQAVVIPGQPDMLRNALGHI